MAATVEKITAEALNLSSEGRAILLEALLGSLAGDVNPAVEQAHLGDIQQRRAAVKAGKSQLIEGGVALRQARAAIGR